jgi:hypothetical protein
MVNLSNFGREPGSYRGGASYLVQATVPVGSSKYIILSDTGLATYTTKYAGVIYLYVPVFTGTYRFHIASAGITAGNNFVAMEVTGTSATQFHFSYLEGQLPIAGQTRYSDYRTLDMGRWYKFGWFIDTGASGDTFWVNNVSQGLNTLTDRNRTWILPRHSIFTPGTPAGFKIGYMIVTMDPTMTASGISTLFDAYLAKSPQYMGAGSVTQQGKTRQIYIDCGYPLITNHATEQEFLDENVAAPVNYVHTLDRVVIA